MSLNLEMVLPFSTSSICLSLTQLIPGIIYEILPQTSGCQRKIPLMGRRAFPTKVCECGIVRWPTSVTAKLSFSRQNTLSHGKTLFLTAKHSFSRQNTLSHGKNFFITATFSFYNQISQLHKWKGKGSKYGC